jgi:hypothetical protein
MTQMSLKPSEASTGGGFPRGNLTVVKARFGEFQQTDENGQPMKSTFAPNQGQVIPPRMVAYIDLANLEEEGQVFNQRYSVGDISRYIAANDGKVLQMVDPSKGLSSSCNFYALLAQLIKVGYPEDRLGSDISVALEGLEGYWDQGTGEGNDSDNVSKLILPREIHRFPWSGQATPSSNGTGGDVNGVAIGMVKELLGSGNPPTRQQLSMNAMVAPLPDSTRSAIMNLMFSEELAQILAPEGIRLEGENFVR